MDIPLSHIFRHKDARKIDGGAVKSLMASIAEIGIINPIRVRPVRRLVVGEMSDAYECVAGNHRIEAARKLHLETVPCIVVNDDDLHAELAMIDENLCRTDLSPADKALQNARRKEIHLILHPETGHGGDRKSDQVANFATRSFVADTAEKTGMSVRAVRLAVERGEKIVPDVLDKVKGTHLDKGTYLDTIKKLEPEEQRQRVERALTIDANKEARAKQIAVDNKARAIKEIIEIMAQYIPADEWEALRINLELAGASNIARELAKSARAA